MPVHKPNFPPGIFGTLPDPRSLDAEGAVFMVRVMDPDLGVLTTVRDLAEPRYRIPEADLASVTRGGRVLWQVEAILPDCRGLRSMTFAARIE